MYGGSFMKKIKWWKKFNKTEFINKVRDGFEFAILATSGIGGFYLVALLFFHDMFINAVWWKAMFVCLFAFCITPLCVTVELIVDSIRKGKVTHEAATSTDDLVK